MRDYSIICICVKENRVVLGSGRVGQRGSGQGVPVMGPGQVRFPFATRYGLLFSSIPKDPGPHGKCRKRCALKKRDKESTKEVP